MGKEEWIEKVRSQRAKLQLAISEYDDVELKEAVNLRLEYTEKIGQYECKQYELYLHFEEIKHKIEMVQARINRGEEIDMNAINEEVAGMLTAYYDKLNGMRENVLEMNRFQSGVEISIVDVAKVKSIYRKLMKILHPDVVDPTLGFDPQLWEKTQSAYKRNDLETLQMIEDIVGETKSTPLEDMEESDLMEMFKRLELAYARYQMKLSEIKKKFPFTEVEHLKNDAWVRARQAEIKKSIEDYEKSIIFMEATLQTIIGE